MEGSTYLRGLGRFQESFAFMGTPLMGLPLDSNQDR